MRRTERSVSHLVAKAFLWAGLAVALSLFNIASKAKPLGGGEGASFPPTLHLVKGITVRGHHQPSRLLPQPENAVVSLEAAILRLSVPPMPQTPSETYRASTDFSASQGYRNWYYLDGSGSQLTWNGSGSWQGPETYLLLWATGDHPGNYIDSVRQWRAPSNGSIRITGSASDLATACGDGVVVSIRRGTQIFWQQTIENGNTTGFSYDVTMNVAAGDQINFVTNARSNWLCDSTSFDPTITLTRSTSATYQASTDFSNLQGQRNWYYLDGNDNQMTWNGSGSWQGPETYLLLWATGDHPGNYIDSVRQWRAPSNGSIRITGTAADANTGCGDGVIVSIKHGSQVLWQQTIDNGNTTGFSYDLTRNVAAGDQINFVTNGRSACWCDGTSFDPTIVLTPPDSTPFTGTPISLPGTIQVEDFDNGSEGLAYHDTTSGNAGGQYRSNTDVDIGGNSGSYNIGWTISGEWTKYSVNVSTTDTYTIEAVVSGIYCCPNMHIEVDGVNVTGPISVPNTGGWAAWQTVSKSGVNISAGFHVVKFVVDSPDGFLIESLRVVPPIPSAPSTLTATALSATQITLSWTDNSTNETGFKIERKAGAGGTYAEITTTNANVTSFSDTSLQSNTQYYYRVRAANAGGDSGYSNEANATTANQPPIANAGGPYSGPKLTPIQFQGGGSSDPDGSISSYEWNFGDGTQGSGVAPTHSYSATGIYTVSLTVTDNLGATATGSTTANINTAPTSNPGGPYSGISGTAVQLNGSTSFDVDGSITSYQWNFGDGSTGSGVAPIHVYASPGTYFVTLTVVDGMGAWTNNSAVATITTVTNQSPTAHPGGPYSATVGTAVQFNGGGSTDPDGTITQYQWNFGDGTASGSTPSHTFAASGTHLVTLTVTDNGGATNSRSINLNVTASGGGGSGPAESVVIGDVNWDPTNRDSFDDPNNRRGNVANATTGNKNFQVVAPVVALPGRGSQLSLNLIYNSQVWTKSGSEILFDIDHDWPAPGWHLGFGKMVMMGTAGAMIIEPDGTRHPFTGTVFDHIYPPAPPGRPNAVKVMTFKGHTTDGSNIEYRAEENVGLARYPNGTIVKYSYYTGTVPVTYIYPNQIIDANGNITNISYIPNCNPIPDPTTEPRIQRIVDSVGRVITFNYDSQQRLTSISGPGLPDANGNATTQTLVRVHYKTQMLNLTDAFNSLSARTKSTTLSVIDAIYYPATGRGYWFGGDSYSSYGMLVKVKEERGMTFSAGASANDQGTISEGTITRQQVYNYPSAPAGLNGVPSFTQLTESWDGGPVNAPVTSFNFVENSGANERTITITHPEGTKSIQKSFNFTNASASDPDKWRDGTMKEQQTTDSAGNLLSKTVFTWDKGPNDAPLLLRTETTDDVGQVLKTEYDMYGPDNSVGRIRDYDYDGTTVIRTTRNTFKSYLDNDLNQGISSQFQVYPLFHPRLVNLIESVKVFEGDANLDKLAAFSEYKYDEYASPLKSYTPDSLNSLDLFACGEPRQSGGISGILNHSAAYNPMPPNSQNGGGAGDQYLTRRGNVTSVLRYADTSNSSAPANPITESRTYDMAGNVITTSTSCCEQTSSVFELATQYAFAVSQTRGSSDPSSLVRVTTSAQYDLSTGLPKTRTDENGRSTTLTYFPASLRPKEILFPTGAVTSFEYDDLAAKVTETSRLSTNGTIASQTIKYLNGLGQVVREEALGPGNTVDVVETVYDGFGRLQMQSRPYRAGTSVDLIWTETTYDTRGRVVAVQEDATHEIAGDPGTVTSYTYNETPRPAGASSNPGQTTKITDPWGRWRWSRVDATGRLVEVIEPNPAGGTNFRTTYTYDTLGKLVRIEQGEQVRRFRYDSLGRLTQQKMTEASATLNSAGERATGQPESERWSDVFTYDSRSNVTSHTDARGVRTLFSYQVSGQDDPLNRLQSVSYDTSNVESSLTVLSSPTVTYQYRTKSSPTSLIDVTEIKQIVASGVSTEDFDYDAEGRMFEKRFTFANRPLPMTTTNGYDTLNRVNQITYPEQYQPSGSPVRKVITPSYDAAGRISGLQVNGTNYASQIAYNAESQITNLVVGSGSSQLTETYSYAVGLLTNQTVQRAGASLMNLSYFYQAQFPCECDTEVYPQPQTLSSARTGQVTRIVNNITGKRQDISYDSLGRLKNIKQGVMVGILPTGHFQSDWTQNYNYDRYGNRTSITALGANETPNGLSDGYSTLAYDSTSNRITSNGFSYDAAGNQLTNGTGQSLVYDAAGRLAKVKDQNGVTVATYTYGASNRRLITQTGNESSPAKTYYVWDGDSVIAEYTDPSGAAMPQWSKNSIYLGARLLATEEPNGSGGEIVRYHHPDRLGSRLITNNLDGTYSEQVNLPFGTALDAESTPGASPTTRRFTSYDRSSSTGLDYAVNRQYDPRQGRFTQPDPLGMGATSLADPQSLNLYSYVGNDPINRVDPDGQFWGALFRFIGGLFRGLRPNVINGSFAYGNHPPISVSFTTNFQNIGVGLGGIGLTLRSDRLWIPSLLRASMQGGGGEWLSDCLKNLLKPFFPSQNVFGTEYSPVEAARFFPGVPVQYKKFAAAITLGFGIHYDPRLLQLEGGYGDDLTTIIEEVAHVEQFIRMWSTMRMNTRVKWIGPLGLRVPVFYRVPPTYDQARRKWKEVYAGAIMKAWWEGRDGYDNAIEVEAQNKVYEIGKSLLGKDSVCGFSMTGWKATYRAR